MLRQTGNEKSIIRTCIITPGRGLTLPGFSVLRMLQVKDGEDTWYTFVRSKKDGVHSLVSVTLGNGQDEQGLPTRDVRQLQPGDRVSTYTSYDEKGEYRLKQEEFVIGEDGGTLSYVPLPAGIFSEKRKGKGNSLP